VSVSIEKYSEASNTILLQVAAVYLLVFASVYLFTRIEFGLNLPFLAGSVVAWAVIGWCQFALFNALHEGLHNRFGDPHRAFLAYALAAYTVGFDERYRKVHLDHHKYFGDPALDPDYPNYGNFPASKRQFFWRFFSNLCGWLALLQFLGLRQSTTSSAEDTASGQDSQGLPYRMLITQLLILMLFAVSVGWFYYIWLWLIPIVTFGKFYSSTRAFCEHASPDNQPTIRTITGSFFGEKILGVFCFHYHAEHHRHVAIPYIHLQEACLALHDSVYLPPEPGEPRYEHFRGGYGGLMIGWYSALPL